MRFHHWSYKRFNDWIAPFGQIPFRLQSSARLAKSSEFTSVNVHSSKESPEAEILTDDISSVRHSSFQDSCTETAVAATLCATLLR
uniref:Uncharacterized protein n=1 Tax=Trichuris muris TaxID=70415 RepID=A0A5S6QLQ2_TRIMR